MERPVVVAGKLWHDATAGARNGFIALFNADETRIGARAFGTGGIIDVRAMTTDAAGNVYVGGYYTGTPVFEVNEAAPFAMGNDAFFAAFDIKNQLRWLKTFNGPGEESIDALAMSENGELYAALRFTMNLTITRDDGTTESFATNGDPDVLLMHPNTSSGNAYWIQRLGGNGGQYVGGLAATSTTGAITGGFTGAWSVNGQTYQNSDPANIWDGYVAIFEPDSKFRQAYRLQAACTQNPQSVTIDRHDDIVIAGTFSGEVTFPNGQKISSSSSVNLDAFVMKFNELGNVRWAKDFGAGNTQIAHGVAIGDVRGRVFVGGGFLDNLAGFPDAPATVSG